MRFNSPVFLLFLSVVVAVLWALPHRMRRHWLLFVSYVFYASWHWPYLALLIGCAAVNHWGAQWIVREGDRARRGRWVLAANVLLLGLFKYLDWLLGNVNGIGKWFGIDLEIPLPEWVLPLGLSFYVFEAISYTVDVIRKRERIHSFWDFQLFIAFFPKLIAGPIMRAKELLPQIEKQDKRLMSREVLESIWLLATGLFMKVVLADGLSPQVDEAFARQSTSLGATDVYLMAVAFGLQIYFDFSSYTRMAIGSARLCGIQLVENFNYPYSARSPVEFWNRWHMSLSRWIRDYLFFPLLGKKTTLVAMCRAALIAMTLCGLWHGAGWTFLLWGLYHGVLIAGYHLLTYRQRVETPSRTVLPKSGVFAVAFAIVATFGLVSLSWLFFRATSVEQAADLWQRAVAPWAYGYRALPGTFYLHTMLLTVAVWMSPIATIMWNKSVSFATEPSYGVRHLGGAILQGTAIGVMLVLTIVYLRGQSAFIYFQF